ncbi:glyoxalase/bleomycin resistance protein/dioxygenase [Halovivax asiaticus JCM 14624]|uniref:Glyoxalase/bleomycin resistance protein/dioxygenase n=1 Tax=Halovivax asiaticus JCM 14624 TaxID=1227490 RepID=M0BM87_9EURY|nr:VOC family protein [Halovivax asiaticus]ELZ11975.1 glyoxalase/bleomycin resistance protein/dioxygenase [Halovivax asiaticus JCM 14624]
MPQTPPIPDTARIGRVALRVADLDELTDFYRTVVGLSVLSRSEREVALGVDGTPLLVLQEDTEATPRGSAQAGLFHTAFLVPSRAALGAALERVRVAGELEGASDHDVSEALYLTDPEGNGVEIYADKPREVWPRADDGSIRMRTLPLDLDTIAAASDGAADAPADTTIGHVHLETTDLGAARSFYADMLGLRVQMAGQGALFTSIGDYHHHVGVNAWNGRSEPAGGQGLEWFEFVVPDSETFASSKNRFREADIAVTDTSEGIAFTDPDEIGIRLRSE